MGDDLRTLVRAAGNRVARTIVESQVVYPRTSSICLDKAIVFEKYTPGGLREVVTKLELNVDNVKAAHAVKDAVVILKLLVELKDSLLVNQADNILVYKGGFDIVRLQNDENPKSGRSIYVEINSCRNDLIRYIQAARKEEIPWLQIGALLGAAITVALIALLRKL